MKLTLKVLLLLLLATVDGYGQPYYFSRYQVEQGLSNNAVVSCIQDKDGFMWFGTRDGLNRFDGYTFKVFRHEPGNPNSIGSNYTRVLSVDPEGRLWVGTNKGLYHYNPKSENFRRFIHSKDEDIADILHDHNGNIWFISEFTLTRYNASTKKLRIYKNSEFFNATSLCTDGRDIWIATSEGTLHRYDQATDSFTAYDLFERSKRPVSKWIEKIFYAGNGVILIGTTSQGVKSFNTKTLVYKDVVTYNEDKTTIYARNFVKQSEDEIWIASESGLFIYSMKSGKIVNIKKQYNDPYSISDNALYTFCKDKEGGIWIGTYFGGVNYYPRQYTLFEKFFPKTGVNAISGNAVREIIRDQYGNMWIGTEDAGLNKLDIRTGRFTTFKPGGSATDISNTNIHGLFATGDTLWIGTFEHGLDKFNIRTGKVMKHYGAGPGANSLKSNFVYSIYRTRAGALYFCTTWGIYQYNSRDDNFILDLEVPEYLFYTTMHEDRNGTFWFGTIRDGIFYYNPKTRSKGYFIYEKDNPVSLSNNRVNRIFEDSAGDLWFGTEGGLCKLNQKSKTFTRYTVKDELPSDIILAILEDSQERLWITTSKGLVCFDLNTEQLSVFTKTHGLLNDQFNYNSAFKDSTGRLYFGGVSGFIRFNPATFTKSTYIPPIYITGFQVYNRELPINEEGSPLTKSISFTEKIRLKYDQSSFSIDFAALSYTSPATTEYAYRMEGLDADWTYLKTNRKAYFTELPPGRYTFKVKASNSSGIWSDTPAEIEVEVLPPFWASTWAYCFYLLASVGIIYFGIRFYHSRIKEKNRIKLEFLEHEKEKEIYQAKIEFFTNVAHEIRTPLTLIKGPMEKVIKRSEEVPSIQNNLRIMEKNTNRLLNLTNQLLDFRRTETNGFSLNFVKTNISQLLKDNYIRFKPAAEEKKISFKIELPTNNIDVYVDPEALNKILSNLLNNAIKYAKSKVVIALSPPQDDPATFTINIKNDGYLIPYEMREKIFETFFRIKETEKQAGTGIGLSLSRSLAELHNGNIILNPPEEGCNVFSVTLPVHQEIEFNPIMSN